MRPKITNMYDVKTKFAEYVCFGTAGFDTTPESSTGDGVIDLPVVTLDGSYTLPDLRIIVKEFEARNVRARGR